MVCVSPGADQIARRLEEGVGVVAVEKSVRLEVPSDVAFRSVWASATKAPAASVGPSSPSVPPLSTITTPQSLRAQLQRSRQDELLIAAAPAVSVGQRHRRLAARQQAHRRAQRAAHRRGCCARSPASADGHLPRLALDERAEIQYAIAERFRLRPRRRQGRGVVAEDEIVDAGRAAPSSVSGTRRRRPASGASSTAGGTRSVRP